MTTKLVYAAFWSTTDQLRTINDSSDGLRVWVFDEDIIDSEQFEDVIDRFRLRRSCLLSLLLASGRDLSLSFM